MNDKQAIEKAKELYEYGATSWGVADFPELKIKTYKELAKLIVEHDIKPSEVLYLNYAPMREDDEMILGFIEEVKKDKEEVKSSANTEEDSIDKITREIKREIDSFKNKIK